MAPDNDGKDCAKCGVELTKVHLAPDERELCTACADFESGEDGGDDHDAAYEEWKDLHWHEEDRWRHE